MLLLTVLAGCSRCGSPPSPQLDAGAALFDQGPEADGATFDRLARVTVEARGETTVLVKENGKWSIESPALGPADEVAIHALVRALMEGRMQRVLETDPDSERLRQLGLAPPRFRVTASTIGGLEVRLEGGREDPFDGSVPIRRGGDSAVHAAAGSIRRALERSSDDFRQRHLFPYTHFVLEELSVRGRETPGWTLVQHEGGRWSQTTEPIFDADPQVVERLWKPLSQQRARAFAPDTPEARTARGLDDPILEVSVTARGRKVIVQFAPVDPGDPDAIWARRVEDDVSTLMKLEPRALTLLQRPRDTLRSRAVLAFDPLAVARLTLVPADGAPAFELRRSQEEDVEVWSLSGPREGRVDRIRMASVLWALKSLESSPQSPSRTDRPPAHAASSKGLRELLLMDREDKVLARLSVVGPDPEAPDLWQIDTGAGARVLVPVGQLENLPDAPEDLLSP